MAKKKSSKKRVCRPRWVYIGRKRMFYVLHDKPPTEATNNRYIVRKFKNDKLARYYINMSLDGYGERTYETFMHAVEPTDIRWLYTNKMLKIYTIYDAPPQEQDTNQYHVEEYSNENQAKEYINTRSRKYVNVKYTDFMKLTEPLGRKWVCIYHSKKLYSIHNTQPKKIDNKMYRLKTFENADAARDYIKTKLRGYTKKDYYVLAAKVRRDNELPENRIRRVYYSFDKRICTITPEHIPTLPKGVKVDKCRGDQDLKDYMKSMPGFLRQVSVDEFLDAFERREEPEKVYTFDVHPKLLSVEKRKTSVEPGSAVAYVDGSFSSRKKACGSGVVFMTENTIERYSSTSIKKENIKLFNLPGEILSAVIAIQKALEMNLESLTIFYDCTALKDATKENYQTQIPILKEYNKFVLDAMQKMTISFEKVKAHNGHWGNCDADSLAKSAVKRK